MEAATKAKRRGKQNNSVGVETRSSRTGLEIYSRSIKLDWIGDRGRGGGKDIGYYYTEICRPQEHLIDIHLQSGQKGLFSRCKRHKSNWELQQEVPK